MKKSYAIGWLLGLLFLLPSVQAGTAPLSPAPTSVISTGEAPTAELSRKALRKQIRAWKKEQRQKEGFFQKVDPELRSALIFMGLGVLLGILFGALTAIITVASGGVGSLIIWRVLYAISTAVFLYGVYKLILWAVEQ